MREQVVNAAFPVLPDRNRMNLKITGRDDVDKLSQRMNGNYVSYFGEKCIVSTCAGILNVNPSIQFSVDQRLTGASIEMVNKVNDFERMEKKNGFGSIHIFEKVEKPNGMEKIDEMKADGLKLESQKKRAPQVDMLPQWGQRKRSRCTRPEVKQTAEESSLPMEKATTQVERRVVNMEKSQIACQAHTTAQSKVHSLRYLAQQARQLGSSSGRRNWHDFSVPPRGASSTTKSNILSNTRHSVPSMVGRSNRRTSDDKRNAPSSCLLDAENASAVNGYSMLAFDIESEAMKITPPTPQRVDLDLFEWPKINISLSRKEKEDDFMALKGCKLPQRLKRRPKVVEKAIHYCTPGNWLNDLNRGRYDVREKKCSKKKPRGLKAIENSDSDSG